MRIISGKFGGRHLVDFKADHIRPTTDRVKESLFNILMSEIEGAQVLDLFAGTGNLGIEAYSRGATAVTFVEKNRKSVKIIRENLRLLQISENVKLLEEDVFSFLKKCDELFNIVLIDPPFTEEFGDEVMQAVSESTLVNQQDLVVAIETAKKELIRDVYGPLSLDTRRNYGDKNLSVFRRK